MSCPHSRLVHPICCSQPYQPFKWTADSSSLLSFNLKRTIADGDEISVSVTATRDGWLWGTVIPSLQLTSIGQSPTFRLEDLALSIHNTNTSCYLSYGGPAGLRYPNYQGPIESPGNSTLNNQSLTILQTVLTGKFGVSSGDIIVLSVRNCRGGKLHSAPQSTLTNGTTVAASNQTFALLPAGQTSAQGYIDLTLLLLAPVLPSLDGSPPPKSYATCDASYRASSGGLVLTVEQAQAAASAATAAAATAAVATVIVQIGASIIGGAGGETASAAMGSEGAAMGGLVMLLAQVQSIKSLLLINQPLPEAFAAFASSFSWASFHYDIGIEVGPSVSDDLSDSGFLGRTGGAAYLLEIGMNGHVRLFVRYPSALSLPPFIHRSFLATLPFWEVPPSSHHSCHPILPSHSPHPPAH